MAAATAHAATVAGARIGGLRRRASLSMDWVTEQIALSEYPSSKTDLSRFDGILNLDRYTPYKTDVRLAHMPLIDGPGNAPDSIADVLECMEGLLQDGGRVLVHCAAGVSRSPFVIALYLSWKRGMAFDDAIDLVAARRSRNLNIDPGLSAISREVLDVMDRRGGNGRHGL